MSRIKSLTDVREIVVSMSEGNPGALMAMMSIYKDSPAIDPQDAFAGLGPLITLDACGIYGSSIYVLFNDQCRKDVRKMVLLTRGVQLGEFPELRLQAMAADQSRSILMKEEEWEFLDKQVCEFLSEFQKPAKVGEEVKN